MLFLLALIAFSVPDEKAVLERERQKFVGVWELVEFKKNGEAQQEPLGNKTTYHFSLDGTYLGKAGDSTIGKGAYQPILNTRPTALDWTSAGRQEFDGKFTRDYPSVGIYRFEGEFLTIVLKLEGKAEERPRDFDCKPGSGQCLIRLKRSGK